MELLPPMVRGGLRCYGCGKPHAKYAVDWTIQYKDGDVKFRLPMCNVCVLSFDETFGPYGCCISQDDPG